MPGADDFTDPVGYASVWGLVAVVLPLVVVAWYAGVTWWTRDRTVTHQPGWLRLRLERRRHLRELDRIAAARSSGELTTREAHQAVGATVRSFVTAAGPVDARAMNLEQLRATAPDVVVQLVASVYPPAFGPGHDGGPETRDLTATIADARELVARWSP